MSKTPTSQLSKIEEAIFAIKNGEVIIVVDDEDRENEGDFICAAETITPEVVNFMAKYGRGLICTPLEEKLADELDLPLMVNNNTALHETAFTVSIDYLKKGCTTGISTYDRATGIKALVDSDTVAADYARPGHIFPLRAKTGGVLRRSGHTEAAIDLARLAGFSAVGVLVEILSEDGTMARLPELLKIAKKHDLKIISIKDLIAYRVGNESLVENILTKKVNHSIGELTMSIYKQKTNGDEHLVLKYGDWDESETVPVRVHSNCDAETFLNTLIFDNKLKIEQTFDYFKKHKKGLFVFMRHSEKLKSISELISPSAKEKIVDVSMEQRDYGIGAQIIHKMGVRKIALIANVSKKRIGLLGYGLEIVDNITL